MMKIYPFCVVVLVLIWAVVTSALADDNVICFESRQGVSEIMQRKSQDGVPNIKCSPRTRAVLWYGDPYSGTVPLGDMPLVADYSKEKAVVRPREEKLLLMRLCGLACHNGAFPPGFNKDKQPRVLKFHLDIVPSALNLQHGRGAIWCLDCHHPTERNKLVDNFGQPISFNEPQKLCGKCHGPFYRDWRDGIHGKRIGEWATTGKKRWFVCTECHNPHDVQQGARNRGFAQLQPEKAPELPKGMKNTHHETAHSK